MQRKKHFYLAGILIGFAALLRPWPLVLLFAAFAFKRYKVTLSGLVTFFIGTTISLLLFGIETFATYLGPVREYEIARWTTDPLNLSILGTTFKLLEISSLDNHFTIESTLLLGSGISAFILLASFAFLWIVSKKLYAYKEDLSYGLLITIAFFSFPVIWDLGMMILLLPCMILILLLRNLPRQPIWWYVIAGCGIVTIFDPFMVSFIARNSSIPTITLYLTLIQTSGIFLFALAQVILLLRLTNART